MLARVRLLTVCTSPLRDVDHRGTPTRTGIYKTPVVGRVWVSKLRVGDDEQADTRYHGGEDRSVYLFPNEHYAALRSIFPPSAVIAPGLVGENFTVEGLDESTVHMGDTLRIGGAVVQVTEPRGPCATLGAKLGSARFPKRMLATGKLGFYARTIEEGFVEAGDAIERVAREGHGVSVAEMIRTRFVSPRSDAAIARALAVPSLSALLRARLEKLRRDGDDDA